MPWFGVDDTFYDHPKVKAIPRGAKRKAAVALWTHAGSWSSRYLTDGQIPTDQVVEFGATKAEAEWLRAAGLWHGQGDECDSPDCIGSPVPQGNYQFHEWPRYQKTRAEVELDRAAARTRQAKHRAEKRARVERDADVLSLVKEEAS